MPRGFSLVEIMIVGAIAASVAAIAIGVTVRTSQSLADAQARTTALDFIQRERNSHVNRAIESELLIICTAEGAAGCTGGGGDTLVSYRTPIPAVFPPPPANELGRVLLEGNTLTVGLGPSLFVDAFARSVDNVGAPRTNSLELQLRDSVETIVLRNDGVVIPTFEAPSAIVVAPHINDVGARVTSNPTPQSRPNTSFRTRKVFLE